MDHFYFYVLTIAELLSLVPGSFCPDSVFCGFYIHFCHLEEKTPQNTYMGPYAAFAITKTPGRCIMFVLCQNRLCVLFPDSIWTVILVSTGVSFIWRENETKYSHQVVSTIPNDMNTSEIDD